jgi:hypothetical protein
MLTFIDNSTPTSQICIFCRGFAHVVENCPHKSNHISIFVTESIFDTTQPTILVSSRIPMTQVPVIPECNPYFIVVVSYFVISLSNQYLTMNPTGNNVLPSYLGNYGPSY